MVTPIIDNAKVMALSRKIADPGCVGLSSDDTAMDLVKRVRKETD